MLVLDGVECRFRFPKYGNDWVARGDSWRLAQLYRFSDDTLNVLNGYYSVVSSVAATNGGSCGWSSSSGKDFDSDEDALWECVRSLYFRW